MNRLELKNKICLCLILAAAVFATFSQVFYHDFLLYDDHNYVTHNPYVLAGLNWNSIQWAFTSFHAFNYHPITTLSHMLDVTLFGLDAGAHHGVNLFFHILNTLILFAVLNNLSGSFYRAFFTALLFGVHPLHVESVAWVSERKDVLSAFFGFLALYFYSIHAKKKNYFCYGGVLIFFFLAIFSKPTMIVLPGIFFLLDIWPLGRLKKIDDFLGLVLEKLPMILCAFIPVVITMMIQEGSAQAFSLEQVSVWDRVIQSAYVYSEYIRKVFWPFGLGVRYMPLAEESYVWVFTVSWIFVIGVTVGAVWNCKKRPYLLVGWLWYLGVLLPIIAYAKAGTHALPDRYTYLSLIGIFMMMVWGIHDLLLQKFRQKNFLPHVLGGAFALFCILISITQVAHWKDSRSLFTRTIRNNPENVAGYYYLAKDYANHGLHQKAMYSLLRAVDLKPDFFAAHRDLTIGLLIQGREEEAVEHLKKALEIGHPGELIMANMYLDLGLLQTRLGRHSEAIAAFNEVLKIDPTRRDARQFLFQLSQQ